MGLFSSKSTLVPGLTRKDAEKLVKERRFRSGKPSPEKVDVFVNHGYAEMLVTCCGEVYSARADDTRRGEVENLVIVCGRCGTSTSRKVKCK